MILLEREKDSRLVSGLMIVKHRKGYRKGFTPHPRKPHVSTRAARFTPHQFGEGFTIIELAIIIAVLAILAVTAMSSLAKMPDMRLGTAAYKIQSDIRYTQRLAMNRQRKTRIDFDVANDIYAVYIYSSDDWVIDKDPLTQGDFQVQLNTDKFIGVGISQVYFNSDDRDLVFDEYGRPYSYDAGSEILLASEGWVRLNNIKDIRVTPNTGRVNVP